MYLFSFYSTLQVLFSLFLSSGHSLVSVLFSRSLSLYVSLLSFSSSTRTFAICPSSHPACDTSCFHPRGFFFFLALLCRWLCASFPFSLLTCNLQASAFDRLSYALVTYTYTSTALFSPFPHVILGEPLYLPVLDGLFCDPNSSILLYFLH